MTNSNLSSQRGKQNPGCNGFGVFNPLGEKKQKTKQKTPSNLHYYKIMHMHIVKYSNDTQAPPFFLKIDT